MSRGMGKRILFYTYYECDPEKGGTERSTSIIAKSLTQLYGYTCFGAYKTPRKDNAEIPFFSKNFQIPDKSIESIVKVLEECMPDTVVIQGVTTMATPFRRAIEKSGNNIKLIYAHHFAPGAFEDIYISPKELIKDIIKRHSLKKLFILAAYPVSRPLYKHFSKRQYRKVSECSDRVVLLSPSHRQSWMTLGGGYNNADKITCIHNALPFDNSYEADGMAQKEKRVLIVGRLHEGSKRLSHALKIWNGICKDSSFNEWQLDIVGDGRDRESYENLAKSLDLKRINFHGFQNPQEFYKRSSIFMMTSKFEGFAMTLLEACQTGTVPIAYDSFSSLVDIVENNINGIIIPEGDINTYTKELKSLMLDNDNRCKMALAAIEKSKEFGIDKITNKWIRLFDEIQSGLKTQE